MQLQCFGKKQNTKAKDNFENHEKRGYRFCSMNKIYWCIQEEEVVTQNIFAQIINSFIDRL